ncbi:hypothetical protein [Algoriphagus marinus]|nr:hypothetical protein [Algoriphagus marinus]
MKLILAGAILLVTPFCFSMLFEVRQTCVSTRKVHGNSRFKLSI